MARNILMINFTGFCGFIFSTVEITLVTRSISRVLSNLDSQEEEGGRRVILEVYIIYSHRMLYVM